MNRSADLLRACVGFLAFAWYVHWAVTAPAPPPRQTNLVGIWDLVWSGDSSFPNRCDLRADGTWQCDWCGITWEGRWQQRVDRNGDNILYVQEWSQGADRVTVQPLRWTAVLPPGKRAGKLVEHVGRFELRKIGVIPK